MASFDLVRGRAQQEEQSMHRQLEEILHPGEINSLGNIARLAARRSFVH